MLKPIPENENRTLNMGSFLLRDSDGKVFQVTALAHWSTIRAEDGSETDTVKWYGPGYVSDVKGHSYRIARVDD